MDYQNETLRTLFEKHSIRKYLDKPIDSFRDKGQASRSKAPKKKGRTIRIVEAKP